MPARLRYTILYAAGLQIFGSNHSFTKSVETILRDGEASNDPMSDLSDAERSELTGRYDEIMRSLPVDRIAA